MFGCTFVTLVCNKTSSFALLLSIIVLLAQLETTRGILKQCYSCRSRGELGNCKDPFPINGTGGPVLKGGEPQLLRGVESVPCASGWCAKFLEGGSTFNEEDYGIATARMCLQRAPSDNEERCAYIMRGSRKVFSCFCHGNYCNTALPRGPSSVFGLTLILSVLLITRLN